MKKRQYTEIRVSRIAVETSSAILAGSIINDATIQVTGQEVCRIYDFSAEPMGEEVGKHFNHEWE